MTNRKVNTSQIQVFLETLRKTANVSYAVRVSGISRAWAYKQRKLDPSFAEEWDAAVEEAIDLMEMAAHQRAFTGVEEPVYYKGEEVGRVKKFSDQLAMFLLRAHRPEKYNRSNNVGVSVRFGLGDSALVAQEELKTELINHSKLRIAAKDVRSIIEGEYSEVSDD